MIPCSCSELTQLANFSETILGDLNATCGDDSDGGSSTRYLQVEEDAATATTSSNATLAQKILDAIDSVNEALGEAGITIEGEVSPYFVGSKFAVGVDTQLSVKFVSTINNKRGHLTVFVFLAFVHLTLFYALALLLIWKS